MGSALAADLPYRKAPLVVPPPPPPLTWNGFYVGLNAGGTFSNDDNVWVQSGVLTAESSATPGVWAAAMATTGSGVLSQGTSGFIGGGQVGYNYQFNPSVVVGLEADIQGIASSNSTGTLVGAVNPPGNGNVGYTNVGLLTASKTVDYIGTVRGRLGWLVTPTLLLYGTGGLAYGGVSSHASNAQAILGPDVPARLGSASFANGAFSDTRVGWTAGGGLEWMFMPNWSAKLEYLYYDLGSVTYSVFGNAFFMTPCGCNGQGFASTVTTASTRFDGHIVRAGVNYHFNWFAPAPVLAKY